MKLRGKYYFLSNMFNVSNITPHLEITSYGRSSNSSEAIYQSMKLNKDCSDDMMNTILTVGSYKSKTFIISLLKEKYEIDKEFHKNKIEYMETIVRDKFSIPVLRRLLLCLTGKEISEDNEHNDTFWGKCNGKGKDHLGRILTKELDRQTMTAINMSKIKFGNIKNYKKGKHYDVVCIPYGEKEPASKNTFAEMFDTTDTHMVKHVHNALSGIKSKKILMLPHTEKGEYSKTVHYNSINQLKELARKNPNFKIGVQISLYGSYDKVWAMVYEMGDLPDNIDLWYELKTVTVAGIGSRDLPEKYGERVDIIAKKLNLINGDVYSGNADGTDRRFMKELNIDNMYNFLPVEGFNYKAGHPGNNVYFDTPPLAFRYASLSCLYWDTMKDFTKKLMARNMRQVLGENLNTPIDFVICYTKDGANNHLTVKDGVTGGTGAAIKFASLQGIPVYNIKNDEDYNEVLRILDEQAK